MECGNRSLVVSPVSSFVYVRNTGSSSSLSAAPHLAFATFPISFVSLVHYPQRQSPHPSLPASPNAASAPSWPATTVIVVLSRHPQVLRQVFCVVSLGGVRPLLAAGTVLLCYIGTAASSGAATITPVPAGRLGMRRHRRLTSTDTVRGIRLTRRYRCWWRSDFPFGHWWGGGGSSRLPDIGFARTRRCHRCPFPSSKYDRWCCWDARVDIIPGT